MIATPQEGYTFKELLDMMKNENECENARAEVKKQHMKNIHIDIKARKRRERR